MAGYILIVFGLVTLSASTSRTAMQFISDHRDVNRWWGSYQCLNGDLVSLSYLDFVQKLNPGPDHLAITRTLPDGPKNTVLYLDGDSYTRHLNDSDFAGLSAFYYIDRNHGSAYHLDTAKRNILIIEISERYLRSYFNGLQIFNEFRDTGIKQKENVFIYMPTIAHTGYASFVGTHLPDLFNKYINQNLQCNLFNYQFIIPLFEYKAAINYYLFNRASGDVVISEDRNYLFLKETVSPSDIGSSYVPVTNDDVSRLVNNFNAIYDHYMAWGFTEVYLSVIPNSSSIVQPVGYNNLIPRLQNDPRLKIKTIDIYSVFKNEKDEYYQHGDTHWNKKGLQKWLDMVNGTAIIGRQ
jgi:hypothetical protein